MRRQEEPQAILLRGPEVAELLGISRAKAYRLMQNRELPVVTFGSAVRVPRAALEAAIRARTEGGAAAGPPPEADSD